METQIWIGALEVALPLLYLALIGQRSIAQWLNDRRMRSSDKTEPEEHPVSPPRSLSVQSLQAYLDYFWRDSLGATIATFKALSIATTLLSGAATVVLLLAAALIKMSEFFNDSAALDKVAGKMGKAGAICFFIAFVAVLCIFMAEMALIVWREEMRQPLK